MNARRVKDFFRTQALMLALTLAICEFALQVITGHSLAAMRLVSASWEVDRPFVPDEQMIVRGNPLRPDVDSAGYRNPIRPVTANYVALGDSQTWGPDEAQDSWPNVLAKITGRSVYNMSLPGYGPLHYLLKIDEALRLRPQLIIVAPYFGNDFYDDFLLLQRHLELAEKFPHQLVSEALEAEKRSPIQVEVDDLFSAGESSGAREMPPSSIRTWISSHVRLYGLLRAVNHRFQRQEVTPMVSRKLEVAVTALTPKRRQYASVLNGPDWKTVLTAPYRNRVLDDGDPRIRLGFELARFAVGQIAERCHAAGTDLLVVLIPTKEMVFYPHVTNPKDHPQLDEVIANESRLKSEWTAELDRNGIDYVDVTSALRQTQTQPYPEDFDGHPTAAGHHIIGAEVAMRIADRRPRAAR